VGITILTTSSSTRGHIGDAPEEKKINIYISNTYVGISVENYRFVFTGNGVVHGGGKQISQVE
jgi:hypothetical protein